MDQRELILVTDATVRADKFRTKLIAILDRTHTTSPEVMMDRLSEAYALIGNLQMHLNTYRSEMITLQNKNLLPK